MPKDFQFMPEENLTWKIIRRLSICLLASLLLASCATRNHSKDPYYKEIAGHTLTTRVPLKIYQIDYQMCGYSDRHYFGDNFIGQPIVGIVPEGHKVYFQRVVWKRCGLDGGMTYLEGTVRFKGTEYPIVYSGGFSGPPDRDFWKSLHYDFNFPRSPIEDKAPPGLSETLQ